MSTVRLLQIDGELPNIALMRLASHYRTYGANEMSSIPKELDLISDVVLRYRPPEKLKATKEAREAEAETRWSRLGCTSPRCGGR